MWCVRKQIFQLQMVPNRTTSYIVRAQEGGAWSPALEGNFCSGRPTPYVMAASLWQPLVLRAQQCCRAPHTLRHGPAVVLHDAHACTCTLPPRMQVSCTTCAAQHLACSESGGERCSGRPQDVRGKTPAPPAWHGCSRLTDGLVESLRFLTGPFCWKVQACNKHQRTRHACIRPAALP